MLGKEFFSLLPGPVSALDNETTARILAGARDLMHKGRSRISFRSNGHEITFTQGRPVLFGTIAGFQFDGKLISTPLEWEGPVRFVVDRKYIPSNENIERMVEERIIFRFE